MAVGRHDNLTTTQDDDIAEVLLFNKALSAAEQSTLQAYLATKWAVPLQPSAPTGVTATPGDASLAVSWAAPSFDGGSAIVSYTATAVPSDGSFPTKTCTSATTACTVSGLSIGMSYSITVTATNATATGPASTSVNSTPAAPFVLDGVSSPPTVAYGLRKLRSGYAGSAIGVRRSDGATTTIGFDGSGNLDTASLMSFCGAWWLYCYVSTWYDQSGNGINATQSVTVRQPTITAAGVLKTANGLPTLEFAGGQNLVTGTSSVSAGASTLTGNVVGLAQWYSGPGQLLGFAGSTATNDGDNTRSAALVQRDALSSKVVSYRNGAARASVSASDGALASHVAVFDGNYNTIYSGGSTSVPVASTGLFSATGAVTIGSDKDWSNALSGDISEVTLFNAALSPADRTSLMANQRSYYATPTVVGPAFAAGADVVWPMPDGQVVSRSGLSPVSVASPSSLSPAVSASSELLSRGGRVAAGGREGGRRP